MWKDINREHINILMAFQVLALDDITWEKTVEKRIKQHGP